MLIGSGTDVSVVLFEKFIFEFADNVMSMYWLIENVLPGPVGTRDAIVMFLSLSNDALVLMIGVPGPAMYASGTFGQVFWPSVVSTQLLKLIKLPAPGITMLPPIWLLSTRPRAGGATGPVKPVSPINNSSRCKPSEIFWIFSVEANNSA